jgi:hypothetical protein
MKRTDERYKPAHRRALYPNISLLAFGHQGEFLWYLPLFYTNLVLAVGRAISPFMRGRRMKGKLILLLVRLVRSRHQNVSTL